MGPLSLWRLLRRRLGLVHVPGYTSTSVALLVCVAPRRVIAYARLVAVWSVRRIRSTHRTGGSISRSTAGSVDSLPEISRPAIVDRPLARGRTRCACHHVAIAG